jgi:oligoendopeptidase F
MRSGQRTNPRGDNLRNNTAPTRSIELNTADLAPRGAMNEAGQATANFRTAPHEFGHAILSGSATAHPDEYVNKSHNVADTSSIMNIGRELRKRHLAAVVTELNSSFRT